MVVPWGLFWICIIVGRCKRISLLCSTTHLEKYGWEEADKKDSILGYANCCFRVVPVGLQK